MSLFSSILGGMGTASLGTLAVQITADQTSLIKGLQSSESMTVGWASRVTKQVAMMGAAVTGTLALIGTASVFEFARFEDSFAGVVKTVDATQEELRELSAEFRALSKEIPITIHEINAIGESAGQLGIQTENIVGFTKVMANLGVATNMTSDQAATALARLANITGMPQTEFDRLGSTVVELGNNLATTEGEIVEMSLRIAGAGTQVGMTEAQIVSFAAALSSVGIQAEAGGTAISQVMIRMAKAVAQGSEELAGFAEVAGMSVDEFSRAFEEDAAATILSFITGLGSMSEKGEDVFTVMEDLGLSGIRLTDVLLRAAGATDLFSNAAELGNRAWEENTALAREAEIRYNTLISRFQILSNRIRDLVITIGADLVPVVDLLLDSFNDLYDSTGAFNDEVADLSEMIQGTFLTAITTIADVFYGWTIVMRTGQIALIYMAGAFDLMTTAGTTGMLAIAATISEAVRGWKAIGLGVKLLFLEVLSSIGGRVEPALRPVVDVINSVVETINAITGSEFKTIKLNLDKSVLDEQIRETEQALRDLEAPTAATEAFQQSADELVQLMAEMSNGTDIYSESVRKVTAELAEIAEKGRPSERILARMGATTDSVTDEVEEAAGELEQFDSHIQAYIDHMKEASSVTEGMTPEMKKLRKEAEELKEVFRDPFELAMDSMSRFDVLLSNGIITLEEYERALNNILSPNSELLGKNPFEDMEEGWFHMFGKDAMTRQLERLVEQEQVLQDSYDRQREIILENIAQTSAEETDLLAAKYALLEQMDNEYLDRQRDFAMQRNEMMLAHGTQQIDIAMGLMRDLGMEQSGAYKALFAVQKAMAVASTIISAEAAAANALWLYPPPMNLVMAGVTRALGYASAGVILGTTIASFEGGGRTPDGVRSGGFDGRGGFLSILHPNEKVVDLEDGGDGGGSNVQVIINNHTSAEPEVTERETEFGRVIEVTIKRVKSEIASDINSGVGDTTKALERAYGLRRGGR